MKVLVDTHVLCWMAANDGRLTREARFLLEDSSNAIFYSALSIWEIALKHAKDARKMPIDPSEMVAGCRRAGVFEIEFCVAHVQMLPTLRRREGAPAHRDPFDRMLLAQAKAESLMFLTHDARICEYDEDCIIGF